MRERAVKDGEGKDGNARDDKEPPKKEGVTYIGAINFETSDVTPHTQGATDIECWTFIAYDHRTEGEIHFNKRDLNLAYDEEGNDGEDNDAYDKTYAGRERRRHSGRGRVRPVCLQGISSTRIPTAMRKTSWIPVSSIRKAIWWP